MNQVCLNHASKLQEANLRKIIRNVTSEIRTICIERKFKEKLKAGKLKGEIKGSFQATFSV
jgi:hypothetical protein